MTESNRYLPEKERIQSIIANIYAPEYSNKEARTLLPRELRSTTKKILQEASGISHEQLQSILSSLIVNEIKNEEYGKSVFILAIGSELSMHWPNDLLHSHINIINKQKTTIRLLFWLVVARNKRPIPQTRGKPSHLAARIPGDEPDHRYAPDTFPHPNSYA